MIFLMSDEKIILEFINSLPVDKYDSIEVNGTYKSEELIKDRKLQVDNIMISYQKLDISDNNMIDYNLFEELSRPINIATEKNILLANQEIEKIIQSIPKPEKTIQDVKTYHDECISMINHLDSKAVYEQKQKFDKDMIVLEPRVNDLNILQQEILSNLEINIYDILKIPIHEICKDKKIDPFMLLNCNSINDIIMNIYSDELNNFFDDVFPVYKITTNNSVCEFVPLNTTLKMPATKFLVDAVIKNNELMESLRDTINNELYNFTKKLYSEKKSYLYDESKFEKIYNILNIEFCKIIVKENRVKWILEQYDVLPNVLVPRFHISEDLDQILEYSKNNGNNITINYNEDSEINTQILTNECDILYKKLMDEIKN